ncbi:hypothetical protein [Helicobacter sp. T3_23-1056]
MSLLDINAIATHFIIPSHAKSHNPQHNPTKNIAQISTLINHRFVSK